MAVAHNQRVHPSYATVKNRVGETGGSGNGGRKVGLERKKGGSKKREVRSDKKEA